MTRNAGDTGACPGRGLRAGSAIVAVFAGAFCGCRECDRSGCAAMDDQAHPRHVTQGIAGAVAFHSDVSGTDLFGKECNECPLSEGTVEAWRAEGPIAGADEGLALCAGQVPDVQVDASPRYEVALDPGWYLVCLRRQSCASVQVGDGEVTTVNLKDQGFWADLYVSEPGGRPVAAPPNLRIDCRDPAGAGDADAFGTSET
jgi:hypothetical protein